MYGIDLLFLKTFANMMSDFKLNSFLVLGVMSGTSLDGIDIALIEFNGQLDKPTFNILIADTIAYSNFWKEELQNAIYKNKEEIADLNSKYGKLLSEEINLFLKKNNCNPQLIASHGHTIFHKPEKKYTLQIGNGPEIFQATKIPMVCDFRVQDVLLNGQGAPLVPIGDLLLFNEYKFVKCEFARYIH